MLSRGLRGSLLVVALGYVATVGGCGSSDSGTQVTVDPGQNKDFQKSMGDYMNKQAPGKQP